MLYFPHWYTTDTICNEQREEEHVYTAHLQICTSYIQCKKGVAHVKPCSEGTMWDDKKQTCDHPTENNSCMKLLGKYIIWLIVLALRFFVTLGTCSFFVPVHTRWYVLSGFVFFLVFKQSGSLVTEMSAHLLVNDRFEYF